MLGPLGDRVCRDRIGLAGDRAPASPAVWFSQRDSSAASVAVQARKMGSSAADGAVWACKTGSSAAAEGV